MNEEMFIWWLKSENNDTQKLIKSYETSSVLPIYFHSFVNFSNYGHKNMSFYKQLHSLRIFRFT